MLCWLKVQGDGSDMWDQRSKPSESCVYYLAFTCGSHTHTQSHELTDHIFKESLWDCRERGFVFIINTGNIFLTVLCPQQQHSNTLAGHFPRTMILVLFFHPRGYVIIKDHHLGQDPPSPLTLSLTHLLLGFDSIYVCLNCRFCNFLRN